jgi:hypothetical protein
MPIRRAPSLLPLILLTAWLSVGCDDNGTDTVIGPSSLTSTAAFVSRAVSVQPAAVVAQAFPSAVCPAGPAFLAPVNVVIHASGASDLSLSQVRMQFLDRSGTAAGSATFARSDLANRFGSTRIPVFGTRTFPFSFPFGCVGLPTGTLTVVVFVVDSSGRESRTSFEVSIRLP